MNNSQPPKKPGLLVEDQNAVEVTDADGKQRIEKTHDRDSRDQTLRENKAGTTRPTHPKVNG